MIEKSVFSFFLSLVAICFVTGADNITAQPLPSVYLSAELDSVSVGDRLQYFIVDEGDVSIEDILRQEATLKWRPAQQDPFFLGNRHSVVWVRFHLKPDSNISSELLVHLNYPPLYFAELYVMESRYPALPGAMERTGFSVHKPLASYLPYVFSLPEINASGTMIYIRVQTTSKVLVPLQIWQADAFQERKLHSRILMGMFYGILLVMAFYNMPLLVVTRDASYAFYVMYVFSIIFYTLFMTGAGRTYIWGDLDWIAVHGYGFFSSFAFLAAVIFIFRVLSLNRFRGWVLWLNYTMIAYWSIMLVFYLFFHNRFLVTSEDAGAILTCMGLLTTTIYIWSKGNLTAKYITIAWSVLLVSTFMLMLGLIGAVPYTPLVRYSQNVGFVIEIVLLSLILAERINRERLEKEAAQAKVLEVERQAKLELEQRVEDRTVELSDALDALQAANNELANLSRTDGLTNLANRRQFDEIFEREFNRAARHGQHLSIIVADIDHFKAINDRYGHHFGDECLKSIADILRSHARRAGDVIARYGGEEFVVVMPGSTVDEAGAIAENMRRATEENVCRLPNISCCFTASFGVAGKIPKPDGKAMELFEEADKALYLAKNGGRNRVVMQTQLSTKQPPPPPPPPDG